MSTSTTNIALPELPGGSATVLRHLVACGTEVGAGTPLVMVRTERVEAVLPTPATGRVAMLADVGTTLAPGALLAQIAAAGTPAPLPARLRATPTARRIAQLNAIDLDMLAGSGADGRVLKADVLAALRHGDTGTWGDGEGEQMQAIATSLQTGAHEPPAVDSTPAELDHQPSAINHQPFITAMIEADVSRALALVAEQAAAFARLGLTATLTTVVAQAVAALLPAFPHLNATYSASGIIRRRGVHLAVGTVTAGALRWAYVPHAGDLNLRGMARALRDAPPEGACTFAVLSLPSAGGFSAPPPLPGLGALLTIGAPVQRAVVIGDDRIAVRPIATLTLSYDARLLNYAEAGRFLVALRSAVEQGSTGAA